MEVSVVYKEWFLNVTRVILSVDYIYIVGLAFPIFCGAFADLKFIGNKQFLKLIA